MAELLPCPFCGGDAEQDYQRSFRHLSGGRLDHGAAIYCTSCNADMIMCRADHPELSDEERMAVMVENWNRRAAPAPQPREVGSPLSVMVSRILPDPVRVDTFAAASFLMHGTETESPLACLTGDDHHEKAEVIAAAINAARDGRVTG